MMTPRKYSTPFTGALALLLVVGGAASTLVRAGEPADPGIGDPYPLRKCVLSDEPIEGDVEIIDYEGREIRVCCSDCMSRFSEDAYTRITEIDARLVAQQKPWYPLKKDVVTGKPLGEGVIDHIFRNRLFRLSSLDSVAKLEKSPAKYFGELDLAVVEKQKKDYPLKTCVVSDKPLGPDAYDHVVANQLVRLAGFDELAAFNESPGRYLEKIREAAEKG